MGYFKTWEFLKYTRSNAMCPNFLTKQRINVKAIYVAQTGVLWQFHHLKSYFKSPASYFISLQEEIIWL